MAQATRTADAYPARGALGRDRARDTREALVRAVLTGAAAVSVLTTFGIIASLAGETINFFREVTFSEFLGSTRWRPPRYFGIWALISATVLTSLIALLVAVPLGLLAAIYLSEFASFRVRSVLKPALEILAGIPTVVYGFFALTFVSPLLRNVVPGLDVFNSLAAGIVMGIMITPLVSSLSEDAMSSVPNSLREGAYGLGSTRFEVATKVIFPAALSGIVASVILALSRAIGETMIVALAAGQRPNFTFDPRVQVETMTAFIVQVSSGDTSRGTTRYGSLFAVGSTLFLLTFVLNIFSHWFVRRYREEYD